MNIKLYSKPIKNIKPKIQVALNRGIKPKDIPAYFQHTNEDIYDAEMLGEDLLKQAAKRLIETISENKKAFLIVDSDCDGMTSAAHLINYLYEIFPTWTKNNLKWGLHKGKQHGINDFVDSLVEAEYSLLLVPDAGTNDIEAIEKLHNVNCETIILDHHISDVGFSDYAITINSQYNYPNKELSGVGVVHKFCQYLDKLLNKNIADKFKDLTSIGMMGDMMDIKILETKQMIFEGLKEENLYNPLIYGLKQKSEFALSKSDYAPSEYNKMGLTPIGAAFFIIPLLNAICRSGTIEEKEQVFSAMLTMTAFDMVPSTKRGHKMGETEKVLDQALRTCTNVKNRQTRAETAGMELLTGQAETMLDNKVLVFVVEPGEIDANIAGLVANKLMAKYQRPVCVTTHINIPQDENDAEREASCGIDCVGSMRGYTATGIEDFKAVAETSSACNWCRGHENAAGISITCPQQFIEDMNEALKDISTDIVYWVDYIFHNGEIDSRTVISLAEMNDYIGTGFARPLVYVENCEIKDYMIMKDNHLKITLNEGEAIIWGASEDLLDRLRQGQKIFINFVGKCAINEWNFQKKPQIIIEDWEEAEVQLKELSPAAAWNF